MSVTFTPAVPADIDVLVAFMGEYYLFDHIPFDEQVARDAVREFLNDPQLGRAWLIRSGGRPVGYVFLTLGFILEFGGRDAFIDELYLVPDHRGKGIGALTLAFIEEEARMLGVRALRLEVSKSNRRAHKLYQKAGFEDHDRHLMTKPFR